MERETLKCLSIGAKCIRLDSMPDFFDKISILIKEIGPMNMVLTHDVQWKIAQSLEYIRSSGIKLAHHWRSCACCGGRESNEGQREYQRQ